MKEFYISNSMAFPVELLSVKHKENTLEGFFNFDCQSIEYSATVSEKGLHIDSFEGFETSEEVGVFIKTALEVSILEHIREVKEKQKPESASKKAIKKGLNYDL